MKKRKVIFLSIIIPMFLVTLIVGIIYFYLSSTLDSIVPQYNVAYYQTDDFTYYDVKINSNLKYYISDITDSGKQKENFVFTSKISTNDDKLFSGIEVGAKISSTNVKKCYFNVYDKFELIDCEVSFPNAETYIWTNIDYDVIESKTKAFSYNLYCKLEFNYDETEYLANVSYMYNYNDSPKDGYYFIDNYDNDLISYVPDDPVREGYTFQGWYKEKECVNKWDYSIDKTTNLLPINNSDNYDEEDITYLYAKWVKN